MVYLLKVLSDIAPKPSTTFSFPYMSKTQSQTRPHRFFLSGATEFRCHSHFHKPQANRSHRLGSRSHRDGIVISLFPFVTFRHHRDERLVPRGLLDQVSVCSLLKSVSSSSCDWSHRDEVLPQPQHIGPTEFDKLCVTVRFCVEAIYTPPPPLRSWREPSD